MDDELRVYSEQTTWLLGQFAMSLRACAGDILVAKPPGTIEGNNLFAIAKHATAVTRAYALGIGCGLDESRDRSSEFTATADETQTILALLDSTSDDVRRALEKLEPGRLAVRLVPAQALFGTGEPREMSAREAIVENIRHLGIHLGELRLTRTLLEAR